MTSSYEVVQEDDTDVLFGNPFEGEDLEEGLDDRGAFSGISKGGDEGLKPMSLESSFNFGNQERSLIETKKQRNKIMYTVALVGIFGLLVLLYYTGTGDGMAEQDKNFFTCGRHSDDTTLSDQVVPSKYELAFDFLDDKKTFQGTTKITSKVVYAFEKDPCISVHVDPSLEIADVEVDEKPVAFARGNGEIVQIGPLKDLRRVRNDLKIQIRYRGKTTPRYNKTSSSGFIVVEKNRVDLVTGPAGARKLFPSFDVPNMLADYEMTFRLAEFDDENIEALATNMKESSREKTSDNRLEIHFQSEHAMASHQLISTIGSKSSGSTSRIEFHVAPDVNIQEDRIASIRNDADKALKRVEDYLGSITTSNKLHLVLVSELDAPSLHGPGLCLVRIFDVLNEETRNATLYNAFSSHAFSTITPAEWSSNWFLRSLSQVVAERVDESIDEAASLKTLKNLDADSYQASLSLTLSPSTTYVVFERDFLVIRFTHNNATRALRKLNSRSNTVIRMLFDTVDRESPNMSQGTVRSFLSTYSGTTVEPRTFLKMLDKSRGDKSTISSSSLLSRWTSAPGYPLVEIRCHNTDKATATQERFFLSPESKALNKIQMNTHIPGYGIEYAKYWKEGWTVPIRILNDKVSLVSETPLGDIGEVSTSPLTCPDTRCVLGDAGVMTAPMWGSHDGIKVEPMSKLSEDLCLSDLNNLSSYTKVQDRVAVLSGILASAMSDERRDECGSLELVMNALFASFNELDMSEYLLMWNALVQNNYRIFALPEKRSSLRDHVHRVLNSDRFRDAPSFRFASNSLLQFGDASTSQKVLSIFSDSLAHSVVATFQVIYAESDSTLEIKLKSALDVCLSADKDLLTRAQCTQAAMFGLMSSDSSTPKRLELVSKTLMSLLPGHQDSSSLSVTYDDTTGEIFRYALIAAGRTHNPEARVKALDWFTNTAWPLLLERYGRNSRRLASYVTDLTFMVSSSEELELLNTFEKKWNLGFVHSTDRVVTLALARAKERANAMIGWRSRLS